ncbi:MAG: hypothetical protein AAF479_01190 [Pseudomonadota bacterium]
MSHYERVPISNSWREGPALIHDPQLQLPKIFGGQTSIKFELVRQRVDETFTAWQVSSVRFQDDFLSHSLNFSSSKPLSDSIDARLHDFLHEYFPGNTPSEAIITAPDATFAGDGFRVTHLTITQFRERDGVQRCLLILRKLSGDAFAVMRNGRVFKHMDFIRNTLPTEVANRILKPLYKLSGYAENAFQQKDAEPDVRRLVDMLREKRDEIALYLSYFQGYLTGPEPEGREKRDPIYPMIREKPRS